MDEIIFVAEQWSIDNKWRVMELNYVGDVVKYASVVCKVDHGEERAKLIASLLQKDHDEKRGLNDADNRSSHFAG